MKKTLLLITLLPFLYHLTSAQVKEFDPTIAVKWAPTGIFLGNVAVQGEYSFNKKNSLTAKIGVPLGKNYHSTFHGEEIDLNMKAFSFLTGYRMYFSKRKLRGIYLEPYFQYVHHTTSGLGETTLNNQPVTLNSASNSFRAIDPSDSGSWDNIEAREAENDIHNFLNQFPFIRNKVDVRVDKTNKTVNADFNGWLAGYRFGVSLGYAF